MKYLKSKLQKTLLLLSMVMAMLFAPIVASAQTLETTSIGGFNIVTDQATGFLSTLELGSLTAALGSIFLVVFSIIAIFVGFRKLAMLFRRG